MQQSRVVSASVFTMIELGMNVPRTVFSPTTNTACPRLIRTLAVSPTMRRMSSMYRASIASCLAGSVGRRSSSERTFRISGSSSAFFPTSVPTATERIARSFPMEYPIQISENLLHRK